MGTQGNKEARSEIYMVSMFVLDQLALTDRTKVDVNKDDCLIIRTGDPGNSRYVAIFKLAPAEGALTDLQDYLIATFHAGQPRAIEPTVANEFMVGATIGKLAPAIRLLYAVRKANGYGEGFRDRVWSREESNEGHGLIDFDAFFGKVQEANG